MLQVFFRFLFNSILFLSVVNLSAQKKIYVEQLTNIPGNSQTDMCVFGGELYMSSLGGVLKFDETSNQWRASNQGLSVDGKSPFSAIKQLVVWDGFLFALKADGYLFYLVNGKWVLFDVDRLLVEIETKGSNLIAYARLGANDDGKCQLVEINRNKTITSHSFFVNYDFKKKNLISKEIDGVVCFISNTGLYKWQNEIAQLSFRSGLNSVVYIDENNIFAWDDSADWFNGKYQFVKYNNGYWEDFELGSYYPVIHDIVETNFGVLINTESFNKSVRYREAFEGFLLKKPKSSITNEDADVFRIASDSYLKDRLYKTAINWKSRVWLASHEGVESVIDLDLYDLPLTLMEHNEGCNTSSFQDATEQNDVFYAWSGVNPLSRYYGTIQFIDQSGFASYVGGYNITYANFTASTLLFTNCFDYDLSYITPKGNFRSTDFNGFVDVFNLNNSVYVSNFEKVLVQPEFMPLDSYWSYPIHYFDDGGYSYVSPFSSKVEKFLAVQEFGNGNYVLSHNLYEKINGGVQVSNQVLYKGQSSNYDTLSFNTELLPNTARTVTHLNMWDDKVIATVSEVDLDNLDTVRYYYQLNEELLQFEYLMNAIGLPSQFFKFNDGYLGVNNGVLYYLERSDFDWQRVQLEGVPEGVYVNNFNLGDNGKFIINTRGNGVFKTNGLTSVSELIKNKEGGFAVYPNPAKDFIQFELPIQNVDQSYTYQILSSDGKVVSSGQQDAKRIDIHDLPKGIYLLKINHHKGENFTSRFVVD